MATISDLPPRQLEVLAMAARGASAKATGRALGVSKRTVEQHRQQIRVRLGVADLATAAAIYDAHLSEAHNARQCL